jgi:hypothetical protein
MSDPEFQEIFDLLSIQRAQIEELQRQFKALRRRVNRELLEEDSDEEIDERF